MSTLELSKIVEAVVEENENLQELGYNENQDTNLYQTLDEFNY